MRKCAHVFDTFEGHLGGLDHQDGNHAPPIRRTSFDEVTTYLSDSLARIHRGDVLLTLPDLDEPSFRLVHIDTDLYLPTKTCLEYFGARLQPGAVVVLDDYSSEKCPGVRAALVEYLERHDDDYHVWDVRTEQLMLVRR